MERQSLVRNAVGTVLFVACFIGFTLISSFFVSGRSVAPLWPASGLLLSALLLSQPKHWWYWLALAFVILEVHGELYLSAPRTVFLKTLSIGVTQVLVQAWLITRWLKRPIRFDRLRDVWVLMVVVAAVNLVSTPLAALAVSPIRSGQLLVYMRARWLSHTLIAMTLTPFLVTWILAWRERSAWRWRPLLPWCALLAGTLGIAWLALLPDGFLEPFLPAPHLCLLPLATAAVFFRARGSTLITLVVMLYVTIAVSRGEVWPEGGDVVSRLARAQLFLGVIATTGLILGASMAELDARTHRLRESEERYRLLADHTDDIVVLNDTQGNRLYTSPSLFRKMGWAADELASTHWQLRVHPDDLPRVEATREKNLAGETTVIENRSRRRDGSWIWFETNCKPITGPDGKVWRLLVWSHDITERKQAEQGLADSHTQLRVLASHLQKVREEESRRIARAVHDEVGQLLTGIKMDLRWIEQGLEKHPSAQSSVLLDKVVEVTELVDQTVVTVQRIAAELRPAILDQLGLFAALRQESAQFQKRAGLACRFIAPDAEPKLSPDLATTCYRITQEALTNVARHAAATVVEIEIVHSPAEFRLEVRDNGRGIRPEAIHDVHAHGLFGMQERARSHGGEVVIGLCPGGGTRVQARFPHAAVEMKLP